MSVARRALDSRAAPWVFGAVATLCVLVTWGSLRALPLLHDEWAYWTQAGQYAALRWSAPAPPIPAFFEQLYVLVAPVYAAKYWPGHALMIAPGFAVGLPALVPLVLTGVAGALVFALARRVSGPNVAAATFVLWVSSFGNLRFRASYFSELTTSAAWLAAWYALLRWRETRRAGWMVALAASTGWGAITRPATMFVFAIPVGAVVIADVWRTRRWRQLVLGLACGTVVLGILPLWSARTTGDWRTTPLALYTRQYLPFDVPGYTVNDTPPERGLPPEMERVRAFLHDIKVEQATAPAWRTFAERAGFLLRDAFAGWRLPFVIAFAFGIVVAGPAGWFAAGSAVLLVVAYVTQAHTRDWTVYYLEAFPVVAYVTARGVRAMLHAIAARLGAPVPAGPAP
ncbi:MAG TPA: glycosyltransferase family 39 protein, partial [Gemmatimonadaceae bacterium]|nr:glycosyltransferase family 39 protein [Gemmatimonadaceae bacterium]